MVGRLRDAHTLPVLSQGRDDLLFGSTDDKGGQVMTAYRVCVPTSYVFLLFVIVFSSWRRNEQQQSIFVGWFLFFDGMVWVPSVFTICCACLWCVELGSRYRPPAPRHPPVNLVSSDAPLPTLLQPRYPHPSTLPIHLPQKKGASFSPWSTRSFGATTGGVGETGGAGGGKRSPLSSLPGLLRSSDRTHVLFLPPWRGGEGGAELDGTLKDGFSDIVDGRRCGSGGGGVEGGGGSSGAAAVEHKLDGIFDDDEEDDDRQPPPTVKQGLRVGRGIRDDHTRGSASIDEADDVDEYGDEEGRAGGAKKGIRDDGAAGDAANSTAENDRLPSGGSINTTVRQESRPGLERGDRNSGSRECFAGSTVHPKSRAVGNGDSGEAHDCLLTDVSNSDDDASSHSRRTQLKREEVSGSRLRKEDRHFSNEQHHVGSIDGTSTSDWRRHSLTATAERGGGRRSGRPVEARLPLAQSQGDNNTPDDTEDVERPRAKVRRWRTRRGSFFV